MVYLYCTGIILTLNRPLLACLSSFLLVFSLVKLEMMREQAVTSSEGDIKKCVEVNIGIP